MTARVDFYVLGSTAARERWSVACRLAEKAYLRDLSVVVLTAAADAEPLDELLWTFSDRSFVPHELCRGIATPGAAAPVRLTPELDWVDAADLLVNVSDRLPAEPRRFGRIAEIIDADVERRRLGRERYKAYRELQVPVETHPIGEAAER